MFFEKEVEFLGYVLSDKGLSISNEKLRVIENISTPKDVSELRSFLGLINYYSKFIKNYAQIMFPLYNLLQKEIEWKWSNEQEKAFKTAK